ncbi:MAG TPA: acyl-CoA dehydrogenase family protein [Candidatus Polarisedimenticolia bacterium]|jgi:glutaryl-CoA dehydrogenase|nr:acyl-CoA dehydrogenase family protein [Candidatus Polarisedimenticolia bacterium]
MTRPFQALDLLECDALLHEDERLIRDTVRAFVSERVLPVIEGHFRAGTFPVDLIPAMADLGMLGANLQGYGCAGLNAVAYGLIMQELERGDSGLRSFVSVQGALVMYPIHAFGSEEQKTRWLPRMAKGKAIGCFGLTEPDAGSDPGHMRTRAVKQGDGYVLNGSKAWITNGSIADVAVVWARCDDDVIRGFLVEKGTPGFTARDYEGKFSLRASVTSELHFHDVRVPAANLLPKTEGLKNALMCLNQARYGIAWGGVGSALAVYDEALRYAKERIAFGRPIAATQLQQEKLVWMASEITKAQLLALQVGRLKEAGRSSHVHISLAKRNNIWLARECARLGREILGANGIADEYQVGRHFCNIEAVYTYEGTHDIHTLILGQALTGLQAFAPADPAS